MNVSEAVGRIWDGYARGEYFPPELVGKLSFDEALCVQLDILERRLAAGERLAGWKIGLTSAAVRAHFGTDRQPFGHLLESGIIASPGEVALDDVAVGCGVEPELCVTMGSDLRGPGVTADEARAAVASIAPPLPPRPTNRERARRPFPWRRRWRSSPRWSRGRRAAPRGSRPTSRRG